MKTIKKLAEEYYKPDTTTVDWNKLIGKRCVISIEGAIYEIKFLDYEETNSVAKYKYSDSDEHRWCSSRVFGSWQLLFVYEDDHSKVDNIKRNVILEDFLKNRDKNDEYIAPYYPPHPPYPPSWYTNPLSPTWLSPTCTTIPQPQSQNDSGMYRADLDDAINQCKKNTISDSVRAEYDSHENWGCCDLQN
jgi:hypothetical protein